MKVLKIKKMLIAVSALAICQIALAEGPQSILPDDLQWVDAKELPGVKVAILSGNPEKKEFYVARVKFPANFAIPVHSHPKNEYDTIISGKFSYGLGDKIDRTKDIDLPAGAFVVFPAKASHYGWTKEETIIEVSGIGPWGTIYPKKIG